MPGAGTRPHLIVLAGPIGAGKTETWRQLAPGLGLSDLPILDFDSTLQRVLGTHAGGHPVSAARALVDAAEDANVTEILKHLLARKPLVWETPLLSTTRLPEILDSALHRGFDLQMIFVGMDRWERARFRVAQRALRGEPDIPDDIIQVTFDVSFRNLATATESALFGAIYDNTHSDHRILIAGIDEGKAFIRRGVKHPLLDKTTLTIETLDATPFNKRFGIFDPNPNVLSMGERTTGPRHRP